MRNPITRTRFWGIIVYFSHKSVAVRMLSLVFVAIFMFGYHLVKTFRIQFENRLNNFSLRKAVAVAMCLSLSISGFNTFSIQAFADDEVIDDQIESEPEEQALENELNEIENLALESESEINSGTESEPAKEQTPEATSTIDDAEEAEENSELEENADSEITEPEDEELEEKPEEEVETEQLVEDEKTEFIIPEMEIKDISGGFYLNNIYYSNSEVEFTFEVKTEESKYITACMTIDGNAVYEDVAVNDELFAEYRLDTAYEGNISFGYMDESNNFTALYTENICLDIEAPKVSYELPEKETGVIRINADDAESGLYEVKTFVNGYITDLDTSEDQPEDGSFTGTLSLAAGDYELEIDVIDVAGNVSTITDQITIKKRKLVSVVAPTLFNMKMIDTGTENEIISDNVAICNNSDVPVQITIDSIDVEVNKDNLQDGQQKSCDLRLQLSIAGQEVLIYNCGEGETTDIPSFRLEPKNEDTDVIDLFTELLNSDMTIINSESSDYAVIRFEGSFSDEGNAYWKDDDIKVHINYSVEEIKEEQEE